jgi:DNA (cytosine-5)-methyltransferase 1
MRLLDLFCCEGGASVGYHRAGFDVTGLDLFEDYSQKLYPFESIRGDWRRVLDLHHDGFDVIAASPPCQRYSITNAARRSDDYPDLVDEVRTVLDHIGKPYIIENVVGAPLVNPALLCWSMFRVNGSVIDDDGTPLRMERHRLFETNWGFTAPAVCSHPRDIQVAGSYGGARRDKWEAKHVRKGGYVPSIPVQQQLLGIDWMTQKGMHQSIPPAYTEHIGRQLLSQLARMENVA